MEQYYSVREFRDIMRQINYAPDGARGAYYKRKQNKRRIDQRRTGRKRRC